MNFLIADNFSTALGKLNANEQKAVKITVFDLQQDPANPGLQFHRVSNSKDPNFWSVRVNRDIRIIVHKTAASFLICFVGHHDDAYAWADRRKIETHPRTGAAQIVEVRERVEEITVHSYVQSETEQLEAAEAPVAGYFPPLFQNLTEDQLLDAGVPQDWIEDVHNASEDKFLDLADHLPAEAAEALLEYVATGQLAFSEPVGAGIDPFAHPDAQRRFRIMDNVEELERALDYPWDKWAIYLHPDQRQIASKSFSGPARVAGSAGTGKTVVALHRVAHLLKTDPTAKILLTTFSEPLANALEAKLKLLLPDNSRDFERVTVLPFDGIAKELFTLINAFDPKIAKRQHFSATLQEASNDLGVAEFTDRFLLSEWLHVVDAWQIENIDTYKNVPRLGRKNRLGSKQRERIWPVFERTRQSLKKRGLFSWASVFGTVTNHYQHKDHKPFTHIIVDEAQDLGVPQLKMLAAIAPEGADRLFFAGDLGQRIFQEPFSWLGLGVDVRGRSSTLKVNYRTSHQIRSTLDKLLPPKVRDVDGIEDDRSSTISIFNGPEPQINIFENRNDEVTAVGSWLKTLVEEGLPPEEAGVFVRSHAELKHAREAVKRAEQLALELSDRVEDRTGRISIGTMHLAKGLEFKAVFVMACDDEIIPDQERIETVADETELNEVYETERHLLYVACTRARESLVISGVDPASEFLEDIAVE